MSNIILIITMCLPLAAIALLEILQHISDTSNGFASLQEATPFAVSTYTKFLPALVMLIIATGFNCFNFNTLLLDPFCVLRKITGSSRLLTRPPLSQLPPMALLNAVKLGRWTAFLTSVAAFIGSVLTIVVSGLYSVPNIPLKRTVSFQTEDVWNLNYATDREGGSPSSLVASLLETLNISYPDFTYNELAFPKMSFPGLSHSDFPSSLVTLRVPALRAELHCHELAPKRAIYNSTYNSKNVVASTTVSVNFSLPPNYHRGPQYGNESFLVTEPEIWYLPNYANRRYLGRYYNVYIGPWSAGNSTNTRIHYPDQPNNPLGCPSFAIVYGRRASNYSDPYYSASLCYQLVQTVKTNVTLTFPGLNISSAHPPVPDESTVRNIKSGSDGDSAFRWRL
jgi:Protein of unknown function (DUF3433)